MLDEILNVVKDVVSDAVKGNAEIPDDKKSKTIETATDAMLNGFTNNASGLAGLFSGKGENSDVVDSIQKTVVDTLTEKVGLSSGVAKGLIASVLPIVISAVTSKLGSGDKDGLDIGSIIDAFSDGNKGSGLGGILGKLGGLFGK